MYLGISRAPNTDDRIARAQRHLHNKALGRIEKSQSYENKGILMEYLFNGHSRIIREYPPKKMALYGIVPPN